MRGFFTLRGIRRRLRRRHVVAVVVCLALAAAAALGYALRREARLDQARAQYRQACAGLLPDSGLRGGRLPEDAPDEAEEYGTLLTPRQDSRALLDCELVWHAEKGEHTRKRVAVRAERAPQHRRKSDELGMHSTGFTEGLPSYAWGGTAPDSKGEAEYAALRVTCARELPGRGPATRKLDVHITLPQPSGKRYTLSREERALLSRTAVRVSDWAAVKTDCGRSPLSRKSPSGKSLSGKSPSGKPPSTHRGAPK